MHSFVYKPFKKSVSDWKLNKVYQSENREIASVGIGKCIVMDDNTGEMIEEKIIYEDIYKDVMQGFFTDTKFYKTYIVLGCEPAIVISYDGRLILHNDKMKGYSQSIQKALEKIDPELIGSALIGFVRNEAIGEKYNDKIRELTKSINQIEKAKFPLEMVGLMLKEYYCEEKRKFGPIDDVIHYMTYPELLEQAAEVLAGRISGNGNKENEKALMDELFYRFLEGSLKERS